MLVLTRKLQEKIQIADSITITVLRVKGNSVRLGIEAPRSVRVVRSELPPEDCDSKVATNLDARDLDQPAETISEGLLPAGESAKPVDRLGESLHAFHKGPLATAGSTSSGAAESPSAFRRGPLAPKIARFATVGIS